MDNHPRLPVSVQVLANTDLLYGIFTFIDLELNVRLKNLLGCVTVCRTFYESAIRFLWSTLINLLPLWHLLAPSNVPYPFDYISSQEADDILAESLQKVSSAQLYLDPIHLYRFLWHGSLIRQVLHVSRSRSLCEAIRPLIQGVDMQNGGNPILPLLRTFKWWTSVPVLDHAFIPLFSPSLLHATIDLSESHDEAEIGQLFCRLRESSPFLEKLSVFMTPTVSTLGLSAAQELVNFSRLRRIRIFHIQAPATFRAIVTKPNLTSLDVALCRVTDPSVGLGPLISVRDLRELSVRGEASVLPSVFSNVRFTALQSVAIYLNNPIGSPLVLGDITKFLVPFYRSVCDSDTLQDFELKVDLKALADLPAPGSEYPLRALLAPILPISTLRSVRVIIVNRFATLDDADIRAVASAWPQIKSLHIPNGYTLTSGISIDVLHHLHTHCPDLAEFTIPRFRWPQVEVGVHTIPLSPPSNDGVDRLGRPEAHPLRHLNIVHDRFKDEFLPLFGGTLSDDGVDAMARHLLELFPRLVSDPGLYAAMLRRADDWWDPEKFHRPAFCLDDRWSRIVRRMIAICSSDEA